MRRLQTWPHSPGWGTYHCKPQSRRRCKRAQAAHSCGRPARRGEAEEGVCPAAPRKTEEQPVESIAEGAGRRSGGGEWNSTQVAVGSQHQDPHQLQEETHHPDLLGTGSQEPRCRWGLLML